MKMTWQDLNDLDLLVRCHLRWLDQGIQQENNWIKKGIKSEDDRYYTDEKERFIELLKRLKEDKEDAIMYGK